VRYGESVSDHRGGVLSAILSDQPDDALVDMKRKLEKRIVEARAVLAQSERELRHVEQALSSRGDVAASGPPGGVDTERDRERDGRFQGIPRATILEVATTLSEPITPAGVVEAFAGRGETVNVEQIRIALSRIAKDGNLTKIGPSLFVVPEGGPKETDAADTPDPQEPEPHPGSQPELEPEPFRSDVLGSPVSRDVFRRRA